MESQPLRKPVLNKTLVLLAIVMIILIVGIIKIVSVAFMASAPLAYLTVVSGNVSVSDGINDVEAKNGKIVARDVRFLLKTGKGIAKLQMGDGSYVILDADSTVELNRQKEVRPEDFFVFNLIAGKVMVISEKGNRNPFQFLIRNNIMVRGFLATMGAEIDESRGTGVNIDCMVGLCQVNGTHLILSRQKAQIGLDNSLLIIDDPTITEWISLGKASGFTINQPRLQAQADHTPIPIVVLTITPIGRNLQIPVLGGVVSTPSPSSTTGILPTLTNTPTPTRTRIRYPPITLTFSPTRPERVVPPTPTPQPAYTLAPTYTMSPGWTITPYPTVLATSSATLYPTDTVTLQPVHTPTSTVEPTLTTAPTDTATPNPSATRRPTRTPKSTSTQEPTPTDTLAPVPTDTLAPVPSDTPIPTDTPVG